MAYYVIENQIRADGQINNSVTARQSFASGLSLYYDRCSKMVMTELYPKVAVMLTDAELNAIEHQVITTQWHPEEADSE